MSDEDNLIERITENRLPHYGPFGWHHWPEHPWLSYQFRRGLGETQEGGGSVSEVFQAASRMVPGDKESWHREWLRIAERNWKRGGEEEAAGHVRTAMNCWLRAADYYRQAEFFLKPDDARRLPTFEKMEACSRKFISYLNPPGEAVEIPYEGGVSLCAYFVRAPFPVARQPVRRARVARGSSRGTTGARSPSGTRCPGSRRSSRDRGAGSLSGRRSPPLALRPRVSPQATATTAAAPRPAV